MLPNITKLDGVAGLPDALDNAAKVLAGQQFLLCHTMFAIS